MSVHQFIPRAQATNLIEHQLFAIGVRDMAKRHKDLERTWRRFAIAMSAVGIVNLIGAVSGDSLNAVFAVFGSAWIVFSVRQAQLSRDIAAHCALFLAVMEDGE